MLRFFVPVAHPVSGLELANGQLNAGIYWVSNQRAAQASFSRTCLIPKNQIFVIRLASHIIEVEKLNHKSLSYPLHTNVILLSLVRHRRYTGRRFPNIKLQLLWNNQMIHCRNAVMKVILHRIWLGHERISMCDTRRCGVINSIWWMTFCRVVS